MAEKPQIRNIAQFLDVEREWNDVWLDSSGNSLILSFDSIRHWYGCFAKPDQVRVYRATDRGRTIGFLPLVMKPQYGVRVLSSLTNDHCFQSEPLVRSGYEGVFPELILKELLHNSEPWDMFRYEFSYSFSRFPGLFNDDQLNRNGHAWRRAIQPTYQVRLEKTFESYIQKDLSAKCRKNYLKKRNILARAGEVIIRHYRDEEALQRWPEFKRIEDSGWKGKGGSSIARLDDDYNRYYDGLLKLLSNREALHLYFLELDGKNVAGVFGYIDGNIFQCVKTGYDDEYNRLSPSFLLMFDVIEDLMANSPDTKIFHLFPWDYGYKHKYSNEDSDCFETVIYNRTLRGQLVRLYSALKKQLNKSKKLSPPENPQIDPS
jgi:CelD/BcsL family acetyltransferase involved in cellulose biosynthesis